MSNKDPTERGWTRDVDKRRDRRPQQVIKPEEHNNSCGLVVTPSWYYGCVECGDKKKLASEDPYYYGYCTECDEWRDFEALGQLIYPDED